MLSLPLSFSVVVFSCSLEGQACRQECPQGQRQAEGEGPHQRALPQVRDLKLRGGEGGVFVGYPYNTVLGSFVYTVL